MMVIEPGTTNSKSKHLRTAGLALRNGFTLIEVLLAIMIMATCIVALLNIQTNSYDRAVRGNEIMRTLLFAEALLGDAKTDKRTFDELQPLENTSTEEIEDHPGYFYRVSKDEVAVSFGGESFLLPDLYKLRVELYYPQVGTKEYSPVVLECFFKVPDEWKSGVSK